MEILVLFTYFLFGLLLFIILNYLVKKFNITTVDYIIISLIYLIIISNLYLVNENIYLVIVFEGLINIFYISYIKEENFFKYSYRLKMYIILIVVSFILNKKFINNHNFLLNVNDLKLIIWVTILMYLYSFIKNNIKYNLYKIEKQNDFDNEDIIVMFAKMKNRYKDVIKTNKSIMNIVYALIVYFNHERPIYLRKIDNFKFKLDSKKRKLGIMQVESNKLINDIDSIEIVIGDLEKINNKLSKKKIKKSELPYEIIKGYCKDNNTEQIINIYNVITNFIKN